MDFFIKILLVGSGEHSIKKSRDGENIYVDKRHLLENASYTHAFEYSG